RLPTDTTATGITQVSILRPGHVPGDIFDSSFLRMAQIASTLRFMDALSTNWNGDILWTDRTLPTFASQAQTMPGANASHFNDATRGIAYEYAILLGNMTGKDIWINVPDMATDDYVTKLAQLIRYGSDANGNPYASPQSNPAWPPLKPGI